MISYAKFKQLRYDITRCRLISYLYHTSDIIPMLSYKTVCYHSYDIIRCRLISHLHHTYDIIPLSSYETVCHHSYDIIRCRLITYAADRVLSYVCHDTLRYDIIPYACATE